MRHTHFFSPVFLGLAAALAVTGCDQTDNSLSADNPGSVTQTLKDGGGVSTEDTRIESRMTATAVDPIASGTSRWESRPDRVTFTCEVEDVATSGAHEVRVNGLLVGIVDIVAGFGDLNLDSRNGDSIPTVRSGDKIQVRNPSGRSILRGTFSLR
jgi:hypothetical protein